MMADANKMQGERDISPAATRARKAAYAQTLGRLNARNRPRAKKAPCADPAPAPTTQPQKWTLPPHSDFDEFGFDRATGRAAFHDHGQQPKPRRTGLVW
jgi:hypothetical protein